MSKKSLVGPIQSTAGAIPVRNEKGQVSMQKVKVHRYVSGKRPGYAPQSSSEEESADEEFVVPLRLKHDQEDEEEEEDEAPEVDLTAAEKMDPRLRRLHTSNEARRLRRIEESQDSDESEEEERPGRHHDSDSESGEDDDLDDTERERRRAYIRQRALEKQEDELLAKEEEKESRSEDSESEYEEYTDSEEEARPRLKPVFVFKQDRVTVKEKEALDEKERVLEESEKQRAEQRRKETLKIIEGEIQKEKSMVKSSIDGVLAETQKLDDVNTDDENEEAEYESWKIRELKRLKRDREERENMEREKMEIERLHNLTDEERRLELKLKPKQVLNKASKGKYKFLQKYYHRGVFYLDKEEDVFKRDYSQPTLEDHFDKTILPKVMQVKNFGRSGRTKYTHLVDQDTTNFESPWVSETTQNLKFYASQAAGVKQVFDRPSLKKRKTDTS